MFADNLKFLRKKLNFSQQQLSEQLKIPRTTLGDYERGHTEPSIETLIQMADFFHVSLDDLIKKRVEFNDLVVAEDDRLRILAISVDAENRQNIEVVHAKARADYLHGFQDPEYISELPKMYFPQVPDGTYRAFEIEGDSMLPMMPGSLVICSYVEQLEDLKNERTYVIVTHLDGIVYKRILMNPDKKSFTAISDNPVYEPYVIHYRDVQEVWQYYAHLSFSDVKVSLDIAQDEKLNDIQQKVTFIKNQLQN